MMSDIIICAIICISIILCIFIICYFSNKPNDKKYRQREHLFIASGEHLVKEGLKKGIVKEIFLLKGRENLYGDNVTYVTEDILKKVSNLDTNPWILAICYIKENNDIIGNVIILDNIKDPGNLGTIIRSSVAFNYKTIILSIILK